MKNEYKELMRKLNNISDDLFIYAKNESSLTEESKKDIKELDKIIKQKIHSIKARE